MTETEAGDERKEQEEASLLRAQSAMFLVSPPTPPGSPSVYKVQSISGLCDSFKIHKWDFAFQHELFSCAQILMSSHLDMHSILSTCRYAC